MIPMILSRAHDRFFLDLLSYRYFYLEPKEEVWKGNHQDASGDEIAVGHNLAAANHP